MNTRSLGTEGGQPGSATLALGDGWVWPSAFVAVFVSLIYLPAHHEVGRLTDAAVVTLVETSGALVGAIGPRQLDARDRVRGGQRCSELMVPLSKLPLLPATTPATALLSELGRHGLALVRGSDALAYVEASDLLEQIQASAADDRRTGE